MPVGDSRPASPPTSSARFSRNTLSRSRGGRQPHERQAAEMRARPRRDCGRLRPPAIPRGFRNRGASLRIVRTASRPSSPPASAKRRLVPILGRQFLHRHRGNVRRVADDEVVALFREVREEVGADEIDAIGESVVGDVALRHGQRVGGDVDRIDVGIGIGVREQDGEAARSRAQDRAPSSTCCASPTQGARPSGRSSAMNERGITRARRRRSGNRRATPRA